jgi:BirA family biotin operon repressor/biotin-[acetyl-CoA-carboxylase] ligase
MTSRLPGFEPARFQHHLHTTCIGRFMVYRVKTETTMTLARREADEGAPHGTVVLAEEQTAGRGRRGRSFYSPPGENLYFTFVLRPTRDGLARLPLAVPLAVARACSAEGMRARIKWPNDIWVGERKLCGMLIDSETDEDGVVAYPGIGINVNGDPTRNPELRDTATSLRLEVGKRVDRERLLARLCNLLEEGLELDDQLLGDAYRRFSMVLGRPVRVLAGEREFDALAVGIEVEGGLRVRHEDGDEEVVVAGEVSLRPG